MNDASSVQRSESDSLAVKSVPTPDEEQHRLSRGTARIASAAALRQVVGTGMLAVAVAVVARSLGAGSFGVYAGGTAAYYLALAVTDLGFGVVSAREMAAHPEAQPRLLASTIQVQMLWSGAVGIAFLALGLITGGTRGGVMVVLAPAVVIGGFGVARQVFAVRYRAAPLILVDISTTALQAGAMVALAILHVGVVAIAAVLSVCTCLTALLVVSLAWRVIERAPASTRDRRGILRMAIPVGIASLLASLYFTIDQAILGWLVPSRQLGEYAAALKLLSLVVIVPGFVMAASIPALSRSARDRVMLSRFAGMAAHWLAVTALPLAVGLLVFARPAITLVFGREYAPSTTLLQILMAAGIVSLASNLLGNVLLAVNVIRGMLVFNAVSLAVNVAGNVLLAPRYGVEASAWLTTASELIVTTYAAVALRTRISYRVILARVWRPAVATLLAAAVGLLVGADRLYAAVPAIATFAFAVAALRAWPAELVPVRLRRGTGPIVSP